MRETLNYILTERTLECKLLASLGCLLAASVYGLRWRKRRGIQKRMEQERKRREDSIRLMQKALHQFHQQNPEVDLQKIRDLTLVELVKELKVGSLSPESALYAYLEKALEVHNDLNCVTIFLSDCEAQIKKLQEKEERGPLYGVPVSIKEHIGYQGHPSTCGLVQFVEDLEEEDSVIVKVLKKQGAIVFAKTNVPQAVYSCATSNTIYGHTLNPHNKTKETSGSSGGEGALIGGGGSVLGIGTDLAGSIRVPSSFCGIAGLKPTPNRLSIRGIHPVVKGMNSVPLCSGPMARDVDSLVLAMRTLCCDEMFRLDPYVSPIYFNEEVFSSKKLLRIGYYEEDGYLQPNPSMKRILRETKKLLEHAGHTLVRFQPPPVECVMELFLKLTLCGDGGKSLADEYKKNIVHPHLKDIFKLYQMPCVLKKIMAFFLHPTAPRMSKFIYSAAGAGSVKEHWMDKKALQEYQAKFIGEWRKLDLDVVICPVAGPAFNTGYSGNLLGCMVYTMLYNLMDFPAGVVPVGSVTEEDEEALKHYKGYWNDHWDKLFKQAVTGGVGLPLSVQCVALPYQDELCLRLMKEIETLHLQQQRR
ncbi:vitamin D3 hydroxylase-associated protein-like [Hyperolius riggenbachi]|uniref:vitamin D3 hydroxylase-associated protein-like n=1 Tax=Hyperolius riggenbachi TaxID=752182 RepID=UPI0035A3114D